MRLSISILLSLAACEDRGYFLNTSIAEDTGAGIVEMRSDFGDFVVCTPESDRCELGADRPVFVLTPIPDQGSRFSGWLCGGENGYNDNPLVARDIESFDRLTAYRQLIDHAAHCDAHFKRIPLTLTDLCRAAVGVAAQNNQHLDTSTDPFTLLPGVVGGGIAAESVLLAERCAADITPLTTHSASTRVASKAPEPTTNTVIQATQVIEHATPIALDCDVPEFVAGACGPEADTYVYAWVFAEAPLELFASALAPTDQFQFSAVFDTDGSPSNNYVPSPQYPSDFWLGTDTQFAATYANGQWTLRKTVGASLTSMPTNAVLYAHGATMMWAIPANEVGIVDGEIPAGFGLRTSLFRHGGDYGIAPPHDWSGDVDPPVDQPLYALP